MRALRGGPLTVAKRRALILVAEWYPSADDPVRGVFVEEQAIALSARHRVVVLVPRIRRWRERLGIPRRLVHETRHGIHVVRSEAVPAVPKWPRATYSGVRRAVSRAYEAIADTWGRPDLIHAHVIRYSGWASLELSRALGVPAILTEHSGPFDVHLRTDLDRSIVAESLGAFASVIAVSPVLKAEIQAVRDVPVDVVGNVVDTGFFAPADAPPGGATAGRARPGANVFRVVTVSALVPSKRVDVVVRATAELAISTGRRVELAVVGEGPEREALERLAADLAFAGSVRFVGVADRRTVRDEMRAADVFALCSESETFGIVAAEAMACGTPVVVTLNGGSQFVVPDGLGLHVPVGDAAATAAAMRVVMEETAPIALDRARESIVRRFSPDAVVDELEAIYARVLDASREPETPPSPHFVS